MTPKPTGKDVKVGEIQWGRGRNWSPAFIRGCKGSMDLCMSAVSAISVLSLERFVLVSLPFYGTKTYPGLEINKFRTA